MTYKITFNMLPTGFAIAGQLMFDGIVAYAYAQDVLPEDKKGIGRMSYSPDEQIDFSPMPIIQHESGAFMASWAFWPDGSASGTHTLLKKWDEEHDGMAYFGKSRRAVAIDRGEFKTKQIPISYISARQVWFYFQSDNPNEVERLIKQHVHAIGKKANRGYGMYKDFTIEPCENVFATSIVRPLPMLNGEKPTFDDGARFQYTAWKPPYWDKQNFAMCRVA